VSSQKVERLKGVKMSDYGDEALRRLEYNDVLRANGELLAENEALQDRITALEAELEEWRTGQRAANHLVLEVEASWKDQLTAAQQRITQLSRENEELTSRTRQLEGALKALLEARWKQWEHAADFADDKTDREDWLKHDKLAQQAQHALAPGDFVQQQKVERSGQYREWCRDPALCQDKGTCPKDPTCAD
jgi:hypothetical protein